MSGPATSGGSSPVGAPAKPCPAPTTASLEVSAQTDTRVPIGGLKVNAKGPTSRNGTTSANGTVTFSGVAPGNYVVTSMSPNFTPGTANATVPPGGKGSAVLILKALTELEVTVTDRTAKSAPIEGAKVDIAGPEARSAVTKKDGRAVFVGIAAGTYKVRGSKKGYRSAETPATLPPPTSGSPSKTAVQLELTGVGTLTGTVVAADTKKGIPAADVTVPADAKLKAKTDPAGKFSLGEVEAGDYEVIATKTGFAPGSAKVKVAPGGKIDIVIELVPLTVRIFAADGKSDPPKAVPVNKSTQLRGVLSAKVAGTFKWTTASTLVTLKNDAMETVTVEAGKTPSAAPETEEIQLVFTPKDQPALPPAKHKMGVAEVVFSKEDSHPWGYDAFEETPSLDVNNAATKPKPPPEMDFVSVKKSDTGKVKVTIKGIKPADVFFKSDKEDVCVPKVTNPDASPFVLEITGKDKNKAEAKIEARIGTATGQVAATVGVVVLMELSYKAELFHVKDSKSASANLTLAVTGANCQTEANKYYKPGVAVWGITDGGTKDVEYDANKNGVADMEPGTTTAEERKIITACTSTRARVIHVHSIRWNYYFASDAKATDTKIKLKNYGTTYLGYIGPKAYTIRDDKGNSTSVTVASGGVNTATGEITLTAAIGKAFKTSDKASLLWPLGGRGGEPLWVGDKSSVAVFANYVAHELGHSQVDLLDLIEKDNFMYGGPDTGTKLRHRPIARYYKPAETEQQWKTMKGR